MMAQGREASGFKQELIPVGHWVFTWGNIIEAAVVIFADGWFHAEQVGSCVLYSASAKRDHVSLMHTMATGDYVSSTCISLCSFSILTAVRPIASWRQ